MPYVLCMGSTKLTSRLISSTPSTQHPSLPLSPSLSSNQKGEGKRFLAHVNQCVGRDFTNPTMHGYVDIYCNTYQISISNIPVHTDASVQCNAPGCSKVHQELIVSSLFRLPNLHNTGRPEVIMVK